MALIVGSGDTDGVWRQGIEWLGMGKGGDDCTGTGVTDTVYQRDTSAGLLLRIEEDDREKWEHAQFTINRKYIFIWIEEGASIICLTIGDGRERDAGKTELTILENTHKTQIEFVSGIF